MRTKNLRLASVAGATALAATAMVLSAVPAGAAVTIKAKPGSGLTNGQTIKVKGSGLKNSAVLISECLSNGDIFCDTSNTKQATPSAGDLKVKFTVDSTFTTSAGTFTCTDVGPNQCAIYVAYVNNSQVAGMRLISFAAPSS